MPQLRVENRRKNEPQELQEAYKHLQYIYNNYTRLQFFVI